MGSYRGAGVLILGAQRYAVVLRLRGGEPKWLVANDGQKVRSANQPWEGEATGDGLSCTMVGFKATIETRTGQSARVFIRGGDSTLALLGSTSPPFDVDNDPFNEVAGEVGVQAPRLMGSEMALRSLASASVSSMPPERRNVLALAIAERLSYREIARRLTMADGAVNAHIRVGLASVYQDLLTLTNSDGHSARFTD